MIENLNIKYEDIKEISEKGIDSCYEHKLWEKIIFYPFIIIRMMNFHSFLMLIAMYSLLSFVFPFATISVIGGEYLEGKPLMNIITLIICVVLGVVFFILALSFTRKVSKIEREIEIRDEFISSISEDISSLNNLIESPNEKLYRKFEFIDINNSNEEKIAINVPNGYKEHKISSENENVQLLDDICLTDEASESELIDMIKVVGEYHYNTRVNQETKRKNEFVKHKIKMQYVSNDENEQTYLKKTIEAINRNNEQWQQELEENLSKEKIKL